MMSLGIAVSICARTGILHTSMFILGMSEKYDKYPSIGEVFVSYVCVVL